MCTDSLITCDIWDENQLQQFPITLNMKNMKFYVMMR